ncbi:Pellicle/biofilm biosynthesis inner membrane protein PelG, MATE family transporter [hydrothermal vent metagenome]|uniref:Pellicle/biofilm biosynthesis inner membrane protein PelG, MATE family transporter n=1 Tax=hydrothermal vent metagenome TaxID=652676 RepID=A0A3B1BKA6_9ZZZZ
MAGIGFEIRRILEKDTLLSLLEAYGFAGLISSGPWVLSILGVMMIGILSYTLVSPQVLIVQFLVSVTYLMAFSLMLTGVLQLMFTRFIADRLFELKKAIILPNMLGALCLTTLVAGGSGALVLALLFEQSLVYRLLMLANFVALCNLWIVIIFLSSMKAYRLIVGLFFAGYSIAVLSALALSLLGFGMDGLLFGVLVGHSFLLFSFLFIIVQAYPGEQLIAFDFLKKKQIFISLIFTGFFFNLGIWADKLIFWFYPDTSQIIIGPLRASLIYDLPIFLAYLSIIPGMAVFLVRMEADFAEQYDLFYTSIREGDTLQRIYYRKDRMVYTARQGIYEIFKVQGITVVLLLLWGQDILQAIGISPLYVRLFYIDVVGVSVQVLLLSIMNVLFYLDGRRIALFLSLLFLLSNSLFSWLSIQLGASFFGYGFTLAMALTSLVGLALLSRKMNRLEYETFMLQGA